MPVVSSRPKSAIVRTDQPILKSKSVVLSLYVCKSLKTIAALEKLFLRIAKPPGNGQIGRMRSPDLTDELRQRIEYGMEKEIMTY
jgi:hypothetical protein